MKWSQTDPRHSVNKRASIVVLYPTADGTGRRTTLASTGFVDTKDGWYVRIDAYSERATRHISEGDNWPEGWWWCFAPDEFVNSTNPLLEPMEQVVKLADATAKLSSEVRGKKIVEVSMAPRRGWGQEKLMAEIEKCVLLCANCHRDLHYKKRCAVTDSNRPG